MPSFITPSGDIDDEAVVRWARAEAQADMASFRGRKSRIMPKFIECFRDRLAQAREIARLAHAEDQRLRRDRMHAAIMAMQPPLPPLTDAQLAEINAYETLARNTFNTW